MGRRREGHTCRIWGACASEMRTHRVDGADPAEVEGDQPKAGKEVEAVAEVETEVEPYGRRELEQLAVVLRVGEGSNGVGGGRSARTSSPKNTQRRRRSPPAQNLDLGRGGERRRIQDLRPPRLSSAAGPEAAASPGSRRAEGIRRRQPWIPRGDLGGGGGRRATT